MIYIIMCGGKYSKFEKPKQLTEINGEPIVARTIRLLRECGIEDIAISTNHPGFDNFGVRVLHHRNEYELGVINPEGLWLDAFYHSFRPVCYLFGDVVFSKNAIQKIVETETDDIMFFASAPPFDPRYSKEWAEPFAYKVTDTVRFFECINKTKQYDLEGCFYRQAVSWELWQVIKKTPLNRIDYENYTKINDWTCDIDDISDVPMIERYVDD